MAHLSEILINQTTTQRSIVIPQAGVIYDEISFQMLIPKFIDYLKFEHSAAEQTLEKYTESLYWVPRHLPHAESPGDITLNDITLLKKLTLARGCGPSRVNSFIFSLRKFLTYCNEVHKLVTLNPKELKPMKIPKRQVVFLTKEEIHQFINTINVKSSYGLRMRALVELLLATGMRISEALSLNRDSIDWRDKEATIIGKGNKERVIFINDRAEEWVKKYLAERKDLNPALFVAFGSNVRLARYDLGKEFRRYAAKAGIKKKITPHILRHTAATLMLHNGANIMDIKDLLGHSDIKTTASYYLGTDKRSLKAAHSKFLTFDN